MFMDTTSPLSNRRSPMNSARSDGGRSLRSSLRSTRRGTRFVFPTFPIGTAEISSSAFFDETAIAPPVSAYSPSKDGFLCSAAPAGWQKIADKRSGATRLENWMGSTSVGTKILFKYTLVAQEIQCEKRLFLNSKPLGVGSCRASRGRRSPGRGPGCRRPETTPRGHRDRPHRCA